MNRFLQFRLLLLLGGGVVLALVLAWVSTGFTRLTGAGAFVLVLTLAAAIAGLALRLLKNEPLPGWLLRLTLGAALLRLTAGALWLILLPQAGYDTPVQEAGYVMEDAYQRDTAAWQLADSGAPLLAAFRPAEGAGYRSADQYGGLLFLSALVYRFSGIDEHAPLLIVVLAAGASALAVPLTWAAVRRQFGEQAAGWAAWGLALYPEAVLLGSSQMREAWIMPLAAAAFHGLALYFSAGPGSQRRGLAWMAGALALLLPVSPPMAGILVGLLAVVGLGLSRWRLLRAWRLWALLGGLVLLVVAALWLGWDQIAPRLDAANDASPFALFREWLELSARWQARQTAGASGWLQKTFESLPAGLHLPFLVSYGITRPLLPAQLAAYSVPIWWAIGVWRALGWTILLALLLYAPVQALRSREKHGAAFGLALAVWLSILIASFWGGGDEWDNPRYRVAFICFQAAAAGLVVARQRAAPDPWMRRALLVVLAVPAWFVPWYLRRYTDFDLIFGWTVVDLFKLLGAALLTGVLLAVWDWAGPGTPRQMRSPSDPPKNSP